MATLEEKILGEKRENYCSSSESEHGDSDEEANTESNVQVKDKQSSVPINEWNGTCSNTGPKGVLNDWEQYKRHQAQVRHEKHVERLQQVQRLSLTCQSLREEELAKRNEEVKTEEEDEELKELEDDSVLYEYQKQRMRQMYNAMRGDEKKTFGDLVTIQNSDQFLSEIDAELPHVTIIVHLSDESRLSCRSLNAHLKDLSRAHPGTKFCTLNVQHIDASLLSAKFKSSALPVLLIYKNKNVIASFVKLADELGDVFYMEDVEGFLIDHAVLQDRKCVPGILNSSRIRPEDDSD